MKLEIIGLTAAAALMALAACSDDSGVTADQAIQQQDSGADAAPPDTGKPDTGKPDTGKPDQKVTPDTGKPDQKVTQDQKITPDQKVTPDAGMSCAAMVNAFATAKMAAKTCDRGKSQCSVKVIGSIYPSCPCPTFVNASKTVAAAQMAALRAQFLAAKCTGPACKCANPQSAVCQIPPGGIKAMCEDKLTP